jgi:hypothetical protein
MIVEKSVHTEYCCKQQYHYDTVYLEAMTHLLTGAHLARHRLTVHNLPGGERAQAASRSCS